MSINRHIDVAMLADYIFFSLTHTEEKIIWENLTFLRSHLTTTNKFLEKKSNHVNHVFESRKIDPVF